MLSGFLSTAINFQNVKGNFDQNVLLFAILQYCSCRSISDFAATLQLQWYNHSYVIMGRHTIRLLAAESQMPLLDSMRLCV